VSSHSQSRNCVITPHILYTVIFTVALHEQSGVTWHSCLCGVDWSYSLNPSLLLNRGKEGGFKIIYTSKVTWQGSWLAIVADCMDNGIIIIRTNTYYVNKEVCTTHQHSEVYLMCTTLLEFTQTQNYSLSEWLQINYCNYEWPGQGNWFCCLFISVPWWLVMGPYVGTNSILYTPAIPQSILFCYKYLTYLLSPVHCSQ
jgi:hypothetical protein